MQPRPKTHLIWTGSVAVRLGVGSVTVYPSRRVLTHATRWATSNLKLPKAHGSLLIERTTTLEMRQTIYSPWRGYSRFI